MGSSNSKRSEVTPRHSMLVCYDRRAGKEAIRHLKSDFTSPEDLVHHLKPGDIIQKKGNFVAQWFYSHFAVYIGNGDIVHVLRNTTPKKVAVKRDDMVAKFNGEMVRKNNCLDDFYTPLNVRDIVRTARSQVGDEWPYNLLSNNCEHFATLCRYGRKISLQSWGIADLATGKITMSEVVDHSVKSLKEKCSTLYSWMKRKVVENSPRLLPFTPESISIVVAFA